MLQEGIAVPQKPYGMICPITRACDILEPRWTIPILVGLWAGATRFNDLRREVGSISPALLSRRLKELERENTELKKMLAEELLRNRVLSYVCEKKL